MRIHLGSPRDSGHTTFNGTGQREDIDDDINMDFHDDDMTDREQEIEEEEEEEGEEEEEEEEEEEKEEIPPLSVYNITTSEQLIKSLKAKDDAETNNVSKIQIAKAAFHDTEVPIPKKTFLIADWLLETLSKMAKDLLTNKAISSELNNKQTPYCLYHWMLLFQCSKDLLARDYTSLANRYPLPPLLYAFAHVWRSPSSFKGYYETRFNTETASKFFEAMDNAKTSKQVTPFDMLNQCLEKWLLIIEPKMMKGSEDQAIDIRSEQIPSYLPYLIIIVKAWSTERKKGNNAKKAHDFFLSHLLPTVSSFLWYIRKCTSLDEHNLHDQLPFYDDYRSLIFRICNESLIARGNLEDTQANVIEAVENSNSRRTTLLLSTFLSQLCLHHTGASATIKKNKAKDLASWNAEEKWKKEILNNFISPAVNTIIASSRSLTSSLGIECEEVLQSLHSLLNVVERFDLHFSDEEDSWRPLLQKVIDFALSQHEADYINMTWESAIYFQCSEILLQVHQIDESIFKKENRTAIFLASFTYSHPKHDLSKILCQSSIKSRDVPEFIKSYFEALNMAVKQSPVVQASAELVSVDLIQTRLFHDDYWTNCLDSAIQDFLSPEQGLELLGYIKNKLQVTYTNEILCCSTSKKRKREEDALMEATARNRAFSLAILETYFASLLLRNIIIRGPTYPKAQDAIRLLHKEIILPCLDRNLEQLEQDRFTGAFSAALLVIHENMQDLCLSCKKNEEEEGKTWAKLATDMDSKLDRHLSALSTILTTSAIDGHIELPLQTQTSVLRLIERAFERRVESVFDTLLEKRETFGTMTVEGFKKLRVISEQKYPSSYLHGRTEQDLEQVDIWNHVVERHLPIFERLASDAILAELARITIFLLREMKAHNVEYERVWRLLTSNSCNLELKRWRCMLSAEIMGNIVTPISDTWTRQSLVDCVRIATLFPSEWIPRDALAKIWPVMFEIKNTYTEGDGDRKHRDMFHLYLARCLELHLDLVEPSLTARFKSQDGPKKNSEAAGTTLAIITRKSTTLDYEATLNSMVNDLGQIDDKDKSKMKEIVQTLSFILCNSPEGTLVISQRCLSRVLAQTLVWIKEEEKQEQSNNTLCNVSVISLQMISLQMIEALLSSKPILFRSGDISTFFALAAESLKAHIKRQNSEKRVNLSSRMPMFKKLFHLTTKNLMECIRLRRDYVAQYLPQLTMLLKQLMEGFHASSHFGIDQARQYSRLLNAITQKSTMTSTNGLPESKLKTLAKPFSTHATHVIVTFVRNRTMPTFVKGEIREELTRGMYTLCDILGPWQKNVMMDMLKDEGERIVMRTLWRGWESQRYKGA